jgi:sugar lactone lactonase YvrE
MRFRPGIALLVTTAAGSLALPGPATAAAPTVTTAIGGLGAGPALDVAQGFDSIAVTSSTLYVLEVPGGLPGIGGWNPITVRAVNRSTGIERVLAGDGYSGFSGDGGSATLARFRGELGSSVVADTAGNVFVSDSGNDRIRRIGTDGLITTVAGGANGFSGDGGPATSASLSRPTVMSLAADGTLYFFDQFNYRIRKITTGGTISTIAGNGSSDSSGDGGPATAGAIGWVRAMALDGAGGLYFITDASVRRVTAGGILQTVHTTGGRAIAVDGSGAVHRGGSGVVDKWQANGTLVRVAGTGASGYSGDGGPATAAMIGGVAAIAFGLDGTLFIADRGSRLRAVSGGVISTVAGNGSLTFGGEGRPGPEVQLYEPIGVAVGPDGRIAVADRGNARIRVQGPDGRVRTVAASPAVAEVNSVAYGKDGTLYFTELDSQRVGRITPGGVISTFASGAAVMHAVGVDPDGNVYYVEGTGLRKVGTDGVTTTVVPIDNKPSNGSEHSGRRSDSLDLSTASQLAFDSGGNVFVSAKSFVFQLDRCGTYQFLPGASSFSSGVAVDAAGNVFIAASYKHQITRVGRDGQSTTIAGRPEPGFSGDGGPPADAAFSSPTALAVSGTELLVADAGNSRIRNLSGVADAGPQPPRPCYAPPPPPPRPSGYWMLDEAGHVYAFGDAKHMGAPASVSDPAVDLEPTPHGEGYWIVTAAGKVQPFGGASSYPPLRNRLLPGETVSSMSGTPGFNGYWLFTTTGRVFTFGGARHFGDMYGASLNAPIVDSIPTPSGKGYYMVASDGGIFAFGDARFAGSMGGRPLNAPVQSLVPDSDGTGYWLVASDGGIFAFDAPFRGSMGGQRLNKPTTGMVRFGNGYLMVATDGGIFNFSDKPFLGSLGSNPPAWPVVAVAAFEG